MIPEDLRLLQECAKDFYDSNYGFEKKWPLVFKLKRAVHAVDSTNFTVTMGYEPIFYAQEIKPETP